MLKSSSQFEGATVMATDGEAGTITDVLFDDERWTVRYLVVKSGGWLNSRKVLVSPIAVTGADWPHRTLGLDLTREQIRSAPDIDTDKPVSRQHETAIFDHYGYPYYWGGPMAWGFAAYPVPPAMTPVQGSAQGTGGQSVSDRDAGDPHLRSSKEVRGYDIQASDDSVGHVEDFLINEKEWTIRLIVVDTRNWWPGKKVLISPDHVAGVSWEARRMDVGITRAEVEGSPELNLADLGTGLALGGLYRAGNIPPL